MCADACVKFKGKIIPDCEDIGSIAPFLTKLDWNPGRFWNNGLLHTVPSRVSQHSLRFYLFRSRSSQWWISHGSRFFHSYDMHKKFLWKCPLKDTKSSYFIPTNPHCVGIYIYFFLWDCMISMIVKFYIINNELCAMLKDLSLSLLNDKSLKEDFLWRFFCAAYQQNK